MNVRTFRTVDMLTNVFGFFRANLGKLPEDSLAGKTFTAIGEALTVMSGQVASKVASDTRARVHTVARAAAREALRSQLVTMSQTAQGMEIDVLGISKQFKAPDFPRRDKALIQAGRDFAASALPLRDKFIEHHLPPAFLDNLSGTVENLDRLIREQAGNKADGAKAADGFQKSLDEALTYLQRLDSIVPNALRDDPALAAWNVARHVVRSAGSKAEDNSQKPEASKPPAAPAGSGAASSAHA